MLYVDNPAKWSADFVEGLTTTWIVFFRPHTYHGTEHYFMHEVDDTLLRALLDSRRVPHGTILLTLTDSHLHLLCQSLLQLMSIRMVMRCSIVQFWVQRSPL